MNLEALGDRAAQIQRLYDELNTQQRGRVWTREEFMLGFAGDIGELSNIVLALEGARDRPDVMQDLEHELADCLYSVLVLARIYGVDLEASFHRTMTTLEKKIGAQLDS